MDEPVSTPARPLPPTRNERIDLFRHWAHRVRDSDREAFSALFAAMSDKLARYAYTLVRDEAASYDILQDVFLKLWEIRESIDPDSSLQALLYTMTRNAGLNAKRRGSYLVHDQVTEHGYIANLESDQDRADEQLDARALQRRLDQWIQELPDRRREAFLLSRNHDLSHKEIGELMGLSERTVNTHIFLALRDLRIRLSALQNGMYAP